MIILFIIVIILIAIEIKASNKANNKPNLETKQIVEKHDAISVNPPSSNLPKTQYKDFYKSKRYLITLTELNFYKILNEVAKELNLVVFSQVSLYNIIEVKETPYKNAAFNKIRSKSIDFVLTDTKSCRILLCIELDDYTHRYYKQRMERDKFLEELFSDLNIDLIRIDVANYYNKQLLKEKLQEVLEKSSYILK